MYEEKDKPDILKANREEYGDTDLSHGSYFDWIHTKNPNGSPVFLVAREIGTGRLIGWVMYVPFQLIWQGERLKALIGFNLMVRKEYRRKGISTAMIQCGTAEGKRQGHHFIAALANSKSTEVHRKMGDLIVSSVPMVIRPLDVASLSREQFSNPLAQWVTRAAWAIGGSIVFRERRPRNYGLPVDIVEESEFGEAFDRFWEKVNAKYNLMLVRDRAFLQWRFREMPCRSYLVFSARRGKDILGYLVLREAVIRGIKCGLISDFMVAPGEAGDRAGLLLMNAATRCFREAQAQLGGGLMFTHTQEFGIMRQAGYVPTPERLAPQSITLIVHTILDEIPTRQILLPESWFISNADHDAV